MKLFLIYFLVLFTALNVNAFEPDDLRYRKTLDFYRGYLTEGHNPVQQLRCEEKIGEKLCYNTINHVTCQNYDYGRTTRAIRWVCRSVMPSNIRFDKLLINCELWSNLNNNIVVKNSCGLTYSLKKVKSGGVGGIIITIILVIVFFSLIGYCCVRCSRSTYTDHVYTGPPPVITTNRPAVYTVPVAPAIVTVPYPDYHHSHHTNIGFSNTTYRDGYNDTHIDSGLAGTNFRGNDDNFGSGFGGTDFRSDDNYGGGFSDTNNETSYGDTSFR